jgi:hypothetical protein
VGLDSLAECLIIAAIDWMQRLRLRRGWSSLRHLPTNTASHGKERRTEPTTFSRQPHSVFAGRICSPVWETSDLGIPPTLQGGTVKAITQCGRILIPRAEVDRLLCSARPYNGKIRSSRSAVSCADSATFHLRNTFHNRQLSKSN